MLRTIRSLASPGTSAEKVVVTGARGVGYNKDFGPANKDCIDCPKAEDVAGGVAVFANRPPLQPPPSVSGRCDWRSLDRLKPREESRGVKLSRGVPSISLVPPAGRRGPPSVFGRLLGGDRLLTRSISSISAKARVARLMSSSSPGSDGSLRKSTSCS